jgi:steroid delta-isomerase-like uncharacterized protein
VPNEDNKAIVHRIYEDCWNQGNLTLIDQLVAPQEVSHDPANPGFHGAEGTRRMIALYRQAFPDLHFALDDMIAEDDLVVARWTASGTHKGELQGIPVTNKRTSVPGITIYRVKDGKVEETWNNYDVLGMMQDLGLAPMPDQAMPMQQPSMEEHPAL